MINENIEGNDKSSQLYSSYHRFGLFGFHYPRHWVLPWIHAKGIPVVVGVFFMAVWQASFFVSVSLPSGNLT